MYSWGDTRSNRRTGVPPIQSDDQAEELEENARENPVERLNNVEALTAEAKAGAALDVITAESEDDRATITEGNVEVLTIESSPEWGGTLIAKEPQAENILDFNEEVYTVSSEPSQGT